MSDEPSTSANRPRRSTRNPIRSYEELASPSAPARTKRKTEESAHRPIDIEHLLTNPKSALTTMDISDLMNKSVWEMLSEENRAHLCTLLPPTAFLDYKPLLEPNHPSKLLEDGMDTDRLPGEATSSTQSLAFLDTSSFTDAHFLSAAHSFQDQLYSGWRTYSHMEKRAKYLQGIQDGTMHAPWKDDVWEQDNASELEDLAGPPVGSQSSAAALAGDSAEIKLVELAKEGVLKAGDVLVYRRNFSAYDITIEKDVFVQSIHPKNHTLTVLYSAGTQKYLPPNIVAAYPDASDNSASTSTRTVEARSPSSLESALLDADGTLDRQKRPNGNAWKCFSVWRWADDEVRGLGVDEGGGRGGRESLGTLFYLRSCWFHDR